MTMATLNGQPMTEETLVTTTTTTTFDGITSPTKKPQYPTLGLKMIQTLDKKFDELDMDQNGFLSLDELFALSDTGKQDARRIMDHFDMNGDDEIEKAEFKHVGLILLSNQKFRQCDLDGNGMLSKEEFQDAMLELNYEAPQIEKLFARADVDESGMIDRFEFLSALLHMITDNDAIFSLGSAWNDKKISTVSWDTQLALSAVSCQLSVGTELQVKTMSSEPFEDVANDAFNFVKDSTIDVIDVTGITTDIMDVITDDTTDVTTDVTTDNTTVTDVTTEDITDVATVVASEVFAVKEPIEMRHNNKTNAVEFSLQNFNQNVNRHFNLPSVLQQDFHQQVVDLIYWKDITKSATVAFSLLLLLISLSIFSVISIVSYISLSVLTVTIPFSVYKRTLAALQKSNGGGHPFIHILEMDLSISPEKAGQYAEVLSSYTAPYIRALRRLVFIEDAVDSFKLALFLWVMTYVGSWFNGLTLLIVGFVGIFSLPKTYEVYHEQIDAYMFLAQDQVKAAVAQIRAKIPIG